MEKSQLQIANEHELKQLKNKYELLRKIITPKGFYETWFQSLPNYDGREEAFHALNESYYNLVGEYKYASYNAFLNVNRNRKKL